MTSELRTRASSGLLSASALRVLAMTCMLLDHMWATVVPGNFWMTCVGRLAFPLYAFQLAEGFFHTADRRRYALRLLGLAFVSEVPFDLVQFSTPFFPFHQNTVFTLLLGLWAISGLDRARRERTPRRIVLGLLTLAAACLLGGIGFVDYGVMGVLTVVLFYLLRNFPLARLAQLAAMVLLNIVFFKGQTIPLLGFDFPIQGFAVLALVPIWLYSGKKGFGGKGFQWAAYLFYPIHLLVLYLLYTLR